MTLTVVGFLGFVQDVPHRDLLTVCGDLLLTAGLAVGNDVVVYCYSESLVLHLFSHFSSQSFEQQRDEPAEVDAPVAPDVAAGGLYVGIFITGVIEFLAEVGVGLIEEVILSDADPEK